MVAGVCGGAGVKNVLQKFQKAPEEPLKLGIEGSGGDSGVGAFVSVLKTP
jgi:hypothetical protein